MSSPTTDRAPLGLWALTRGERPKFAWAILWMALGILLVFFVPQITARVIDGFPATHGRVGPFEPPAELARIAETLGLPPTPWGWLGLAALAVVLLTGVAGLAQFAQGRTAARASERILARLRKNVYGHLMDLPASYFDQADTGDLVQRCTSDVDTVRIFLSTQVVEIARAVLLIACALPMLFALDVRLAWVSMALLPFIVIYSLLFFRSLKEVFRASDEAEGRMTAVLQENLTGIRVVRSFGRQSYEETKFAEANQEHRQRTLDLFHILSLFWSISDILCMTQLGLVLFFGAAWCFDGSMTIGTMVAFQQYAAMIIWPVRQMGRTLVDAGKAKVALKRLGEILHHPLESEVLVQRVAGLSPSMPSEWTGLEAENLHFAFPRSSEDGSAPSTDGGDSEKEPVLNGISFRLEPGRTLALVGPPGSGKSVLVQLLLGLYDYGSPHGSGSLRWSGQELRSLPREGLRRAIAAVLQSPFLYAKTIETNLRIGASEAARDEIIAATQAASLHGSIEGFDAGYDTLIGERGVTLSGGQKQRMAIARALLKDAPLLILDDALSAVDHDTEQQILEALRDRASHQSTLIISHRLTSVCHADEILVLRRGRVIERGDHATLLQKGGAYAHLWKLQTSPPAPAGAAPDPRSTPASTPSGGPR